MIISIKVYYSWVQTIFLLLFVLIMLLKESQRIRTTGGLKIIHSFKLPRAALEPNNDRRSYQDSFWITNMIISL